MTRPFRWLLAAAGLTVALACGDTRAARQAAEPATQSSGGINRPEHRDKPTVLLISVDGFRTDYLDRMPLPNFRRVMQRGVRAAAMRPVFPTITFPNHYSLVTGLHPGRHGIVHNVFFDPDRNASYTFRDQAAVSDGSWYGGEPIWVTAERQGMVAACFFWPGSEAAIKGVRPTFWNKYDDRVPNAERVATVLGWLRLPPERRPHVITLYFADIDVASHATAIEGPEVARAVTGLDATLGSLLDGIATLPDGGRVILLITSDHGMANVLAPQVLRIGSLIDTEHVRVGYDGPIVGLHVSGGLEAMRRVRDQMNGKLTHGRAYLRSELPEHYHMRDAPRIGDVVVIMDEGWVMTRSAVSRALVQKAWGAHGWAPELDSMRALFLIAGPGIRKGTTIPQVENVDVYPLMTELLGLASPDGIDGQRGRIGALVRE